VPPSGEADFRFKHHLAHGSILLLVHAPVHFGASAAGPIRRAGEFDIVVPALSFATHGRLDRDAVRRYAERAAGTWVDVFLLSGSTTRGDLLTVADRAALLDLWLDVLPASRLMACCWVAEDVAEAEDRGMAPMAVMHDVPAPSQALDLFAALPRHAFVYSHPMYGGVVLDPTLAETAATAGVLPAGGKIAKIPVDGIAALRQATGADFRLWDGSSRHVEASIRAGASGVIATPLSMLPNPFPDRDITLLQQALTKIQGALDALPTRADRTAWPTGRVGSPLSFPSAVGTDGAAR